MGWTGAEAGIVEGALAGAEGAVAAEIEGLMSEAYAGRGPDGGGAAAIGPPVVAGPATTCGAGVASAVGACATGAGASNACAVTGALTPADGVVAAAGSVGVI
ncbi:hypothetical protein [Mycobacterium sp. SP-6446]|uniref:hypothetical protein n=1 Tax=Mycobacterium sp. SP-6446 TaxID=1834162 RepID=UPI00097B7654|nr:hypothetical protein [Mycobacterium sp. SP-6446]OMC17687.1 hypothetical protein A5736_15740 [Mycobacterium sp. SP-6446]